MARVILLPALEDKLFDIVEVLYKKEYFGFIESAFNYVDDIVNFIYTIPSLKHKRTRNKKHGEYYCRYKANRNTTWYITFDIEDDLYLIKNITNNHSRDYPKFIAGL